MLECVTKFDQGQVQQEANAVTTNPTTTTGDNSIATKKIPQTGATPVFMIVLGSVVLVAGIFVVANKKYRDIK
jgi:LPXTG-motif cell wall-anchored protein